MIGRLIAGALFIALSAGGIRQFQRAADWWRTRHPRRSHP